MYIRYDFFESHYIGVPIIGRDLSKVKTKVLNQRYNWAKFYKKMVRKQQEEEEGEERRANAGRKRNTH